MCDRHLAPGMLGPKPRVSSKMTVKVKSIYFKKGQGMWTWTFYMKTDKQKIGPNSFITFISTLKFQGTYKKEAEGGSQCTLVCVVVMVGVYVFRFPKTPI